MALGASVVLPIMINGLTQEQYDEDGGCIINVRDLIGNPVEVKKAMQPKELTSPQWSSGTAKVGEEVKLSVSTTNVREGESVTFTIWEDGADMEADAPVYKKWGYNHGGKAEIKWRYVYIHDPDNPLTEKPKFIFTAKSFRCEMAEAGSVEMYSEIKATIVDKCINPIKDMKYVLISSNNDKIEGTTGDDGLIEETDLIPCEYKIQIEKKEEE